MTLSRALLLLAGLPLLARAADVNVEGRNIRVEFDAAMRSRVVARTGAAETVIGPVSASEFLSVPGSEIREFSLAGHKQEAVRDILGAGRRWILTGAAPGVKKTVSVTVYNDFPSFAFFDVEYTNTGTADLAVEGWTSNAYTITAPAAGEPTFWSYQSGSYKNRPDWVLPLKPGFSQANFLGMNSSDYGGGTPVVDVWHKGAGIAVGHVETVPRLVSLPVAQTDARSATVAVKYENRRSLKPGETWKTFRTFVAVHRGDYFAPLADYARAMARQGLKFEPSPESAFGPIWCAWGYGRTFTPDQVYGALPVVKKLGFTWVTLDDGWQTNEGDWALQPAKFPNGDADMKAMVDRFHKEGFKAQLWWAPLAADDPSDVLRDHPDMLLLNADGSRQRITYWNAWYMCPSSPKVIDYHRRLVTKMFRDWDYDGLKLDGQHMNGVPPCHNPAHKHARPEDSVEGLPKFFQAIFDAARAVKKDAVIEWCPCGTAFSFHVLPHMNMSVASDPRGSFQIRSKGKTVKALHGDDVAFFGDHVELSTGRDDFASTMGIGGVIGTEFTWPPGSSSRPRGALTPEREEYFAKWLRLYKEKMLSRGAYQGALYDIGFDRPEGHAIRKGQRLYYAFFAPNWDGPIELRGLAGRRYRVTDYANGKDMGTVRGPSASLTVAFEKHLLLEAIPE
jgi:alpha-galactosidase